MPFKKKPPLQSVVPIERNCKKRYAIQCTGSELLHLRLSMSETERQVRQRKISARKRERKAREMKLRHKKALQEIRKPTEGEAPAHLPILYP
jgi:hypothetical protein